jgi:large subunit ribosomal protein L15
MNLHSLKPAAGSRRPRKRVGRGPGSGNGTTAGKGNKGHKARSGYSSTFKEGGQMPLVRRLPKFGFEPPNKQVVDVINIADLVALLEKGKLSTTMTLESLVEVGVARKRTKIKILSEGEVTKAITITAHAFSAVAKEKIEKAGGKVIVAERTLAEAETMKSAGDVQKALVTPKKSVEKHKKAIKLEKKKAAAIKAAK